MESRTRTIVKTFSWRVLAALITSVIAWRLSGDCMLGVSVGLADCFIKILLYYVHERAWNKVSFGYKARPATESKETETTRELVGASKR